MDDGATGTNTYNDAAGGTYSIVTAAADNDKHGIFWDNECFKFAVGKELWAECRFSLTEASTNESSFAFGFSDGINTSTNFLQSDAAGPPASYDGCAIFKTPETALTMNFETSNAGTQNTLSAFATHVSGAWQRMGFHFDGDLAGSGIAKVTPFFHNGTSWTKGTAQSLTLAGLEEMHLFVDLKAGPSAAAETMILDYVAAVQLR